MSPNAPRPVPQSFRDRWAALRNVPPFLRLVWRAGPWLAALTAGLRLARALIPVAALWVGKLIVDEVVHLSALPGLPHGAAAWWQAGQGTRIAGLLAAEFGLAIAQDLLGRLIALTESLLSERLTNDLSLRMMDHAATLDLAHFEDAVFQDKLDRARRQTAFRLPLLGQILGQAESLITVASLAGGLIAFNPWLVVLLVLTLVPAFLAEAHFNARSYSLDYGRTPERREMDYVRQIAASADTAKEIKSFGLHGFLRDRYGTLSRRFYAQNRAVARARAGWGALFSALGTLGYYAAYVWIVAHTVTGRLSVGDLAFLAGAFQRLRTLMEALLSAFGQVAAQALYLDDLFGFFAVRPRITSGSLPVPQPIRRGIVFQDVGFRYPGGERWAVRGLSFTLHAGETLALVGENGAGKTTLVKLLTRLYDPDEGRILLDGRDLRDYDLDALRAAMGVIFQDFVRFNLTAGDNIAVGRIEARGDGARIAAAAGRALADKVIARLPAGYDQMIGKRFANGVELSGGEWQKIAIARAYMRDAQVLILDEPTAALDARSEYEVFERFKELSQGKSAVLISHRFSSVRMADRILVLGGGHVEAQGTHEELMAQGGRYRELFELQAEGYR